MFFAHWCFSWGKLLSPSLFWLLRELFLLLLLSVFLYCPWLTSSKPILLLHPHVSCTFISHSTILTWTGAGRRAALHCIPAKLGGRSSLAQTNDPLPHGKPHTARAHSSDLHLQNCRLKSQPPAVAQIGASRPGTGALDVV